MEEVSKMNKGKIVDNNAFALAKFKNDSSYWLS